MTAEEILEKFDNYVDQHTRNVRGSIYQDPYKSDFFELCLEAYKNQYFDVNCVHRLTGDAMSDTFSDRWMDLDDEYRERKFNLLGKVLQMWDEWRYALKRIRY